MSATPPAPLGPDWKPWGERLVSYMTRVRSQLVTFDAGDKATDDGIFVWSRAGYPVVSKGGEYKQVVVEGGYAQLKRTATQTAGSTNTAYGVAWDAIAFGEGITLDASDSTKVVFAEGGKFVLSLSAQLKSNSSASKSIWMWPRLNGTDVAGSTLKASITSSDDDVAVCRTTILQVTAGQYLQAMFAVSDVTLLLNAPATESFAPSSPAVTLSITRFMQ